MNTVLSRGVLSLSLLELCDTISEHRSLRKAQVLSTEAYTERIGTVMHRFLILMLHREGRKPFWMRVDRRAGASAMRLILKLGTVPARDVVSIAIDNDDSE